MTSERARCSFCGRDGDADRLVAGSGFRICPGCVARSAQIVEEELGPR